MALPPDSTRGAEGRWPPEKVVAEVRRRIEALAEELHARLTDSREEVNALLAEHAWRHGQVVAAVLAEAGWAEDDYWAVLTEHVERLGRLLPRE